MAHNRKFVPGRIYLVEGRLLNSKKTACIHDDLEKIVIDSGILENAPFKWIGLMYRFGTRNMFKPNYMRIDKKDGELPIAVEIKFEILRWADHYDVPFLTEILMIAGLEALLHVCNKYKLPKEYITAERAKYGNIPETIEELEATRERS